MAVFLATACVQVVATAQAIPDATAVDGEIRKIMSRTHANGMAVGIIDHGRVSHVNDYGIRNTNGDPLTTDTVGSLAAGNLQATATEGVQSRPKTAPPGLGLISLS
jgi:hypothetical protein